MKKLFAVLLAVAMLCTMCISAFAATVTTTGDTSASLTVKYSEGTGKKDNYAATIIWGSMEFTYTAGSQKWNTEKMIWENDVAASWSQSTITVKNKSSQSIDVTFGYTPEQDSKGVEGYTVTTIKDVTIDERFVTNSTQTYTVEKATAGENGANGTETTAEFTITPYGIYTGTNTDAVKVGTITISLS